MKRTKTLWLHGGQEKPFERNGKTYNKFPVQFLYSDEPKPWNDVPLKQRAHLINCINGDEFEKVFPGIASKIGETKQITITLETK